MTIETRYATLTFAAAGECLQDPLGAVQCAEECSDREAGRLIAASTGKPIMDAHEASAVEALAGYQAVCTVYDTEHDCSGGVTLYERRS